VSDARAWSCVECLCGSYSAGVAAEGWACVGLLLGVPNVHLVADDDPNNGDMHEVVKGKFFAFKGPTDQHKPYMTKRPSDYLDVFKHKKVQGIVRLNNKEYKIEPLIAAGFQHHDLFFVDCSTPSDAIVDRFLKISEKTEGALAVHCLAGLGRTGTLIGMYMMKHMGFTANECIAWLRIVRPGSVIGPQQNYLKNQEQRMRALGKHVSGLGLDGERSPVSADMAYFAGECNPDASAQLADQITKGMQLRDKFRGANSQGHAQARHARARADAALAPPTTLPPVERGFPGINAAPHAAGSAPAPGAPRDAGARNQHNSASGASSASGGGNSSVFRVHLAAAPDTTSFSHNVSPTAARLARRDSVGGGSDGFLSLQAGSHALQMPRGGHPHHQPSAADTPQPSTPNRFTPTNIRHSPGRQMSAGRLRGALGAHRR